MQHFHPFAGRVTHLPLGALATYKDTPQGLGQARVRLEEARAHWPLLAFKLVCTRRPGPLEDRRKWLIVVTNPRTRERAALRRAPIPVGHDDGIDFVPAPPSRHPRPFAGPVAESVYQPQQYRTKRRGSRRAKAPSKDWDAMSAPQPPASPVAPLALPSRRALNPITKT